MEVVYYQDEKTGRCPVKDFLLPYRNAKKTILARLVAIIIFICERNNVPPLGVGAGPVKGFSLFKIRLKKDQNTLIRIMYFCHKNNLVLLHGFEKPIHYTSERDKARYQQREFEIADSYRKNFIKNETLYEEYE